MSFGKSLIILIICLSCNDNRLRLTKIHKSRTPIYKIELCPTKDTIHFALSEKSYNSIISFNLFLHGKNEYIAFYENKSESVSIYNFETKELVKSIDIKKLLNKKHLYKTSVYVKNLDSILVSNATSLYLFDSAGKTLASIQYHKRPKYAWAYFKNTVPPVFNNTIMYACIRPYVKQTSLQEIKQWKIIFKYDLKDRKATIHYEFPKKYKEHYYGHNFLDYNYCYNQSGNFVISFAADTNVYETDLSNLEITYNAKSQFHFGDIPPVSKSDLLKGEELKQYSLRNSYGPIFFDPNSRRYLRLAKHKISETNYRANDIQRKESVIILDEELRIVGESIINKQFLFSTIFFSRDGNVYARVKPEDEYSLHFVKLNYQDKK